MGARAARPGARFLSRPGKQFRARLVELAVAGRGPGDDPPALPALVEIIHAGSLIVDDIEDDSASAGAPPALHRLYGLPLALNTGNWMYFWALELLDALELPRRGRGRAASARIVRAMARCHLGQALDLAVPVGQLSPARVPTVVRRDQRAQDRHADGAGGVPGALAAGARAGAWSRRWRASGAGWAWACRCSTTSAT